MSRGENQVAHMVILSQTFSRLVAATFFFARRNRYEMVGLVGIILVAAGQRDK